MYSGYRPGEGFGERNIQPWIMMTKVFFWGEHISFHAQGMCGHTHSNKCYHNNLLPCYFSQSGITKNRVSHHFSSHWTLCHSNHFLSSTWERNTTIATHCLGRNSVSNKPRHRQLKARLVYPCSDELCRGISDRVSVWLRLCIHVEKMDVGMGGGGASGGCWLGWADEGGGD